MIEMNPDALEGPISDRLQEVGFDEAATFMRDVAQGMRCLLYYAKKNGGVSKPFTGAGWIAAYAILVDQNVLKNGSLVDDEAEAFAEKYGVGRFS